MKKIFYLIVICVSLANVSYSQTLITTIKTPKGYTVPDTYDMTGYGSLKSIDESLETDMSSSELSAIQKYVELTYTGAVLISEPTYLYNCHPLHGINRNRDLIVG